MRCNSDPILAHLDQAETLARKIYRSMQPLPYSLDDAVGEAHLALVEAASRFDPARETNFWTYAKARVKGAVINMNRRKRIEGEPVDDLTVEENRDGYLDAQRMMSYFSQREAAMIRLRVERDYKYQQIGDEFGVSKQRAYRIVRRALYRAQRQAMLVSS